MNEQPSGAGQATTPSGATPTTPTAAPAAFRTVVVDAPQLTTERRRLLEETFTASLLKTFGDADAVRRASLARAATPQAWEQAEALAYGEVAAKLTDKEAAMLAMRAQGGARFDIEWLPAV
jgi:hypothetical protein